jgi:two-component system sensor histidine kinase KdpD
LNVARADEALSAIAQVIRSTLDLAACRIHTTTAPDADAPGADDSLVAWVVANGHAAIRQADGTTRLTDSPELPPVDLASAQALFLPLQVRGRGVGVLELEAWHPLVLAPEQRRFLTALAYYAALAVERARLAVEADHAEALRETDRLKNALLASVSHDLRTPLTTIKALAHDLARTDERAAVIVEESDRLNRLVADLLDLSRLQGGALPLALELNAVDDLAGALVRRVTGLLGDRDLRVSLEDGGTLLVGRFDLAHSLRILANLVENAHKYAPPGSPIDLVVHRAGDRLELTVADRGPGIPEAERERIFEPFYRPAGTPPDVGGTGLGLAIARRLAEAQDGTLVHAPRPGGGSFFTLSLPAAGLPIPEPSAPASRL